jgi:predicted lipoprotein with Yx(FWY)xxD motif/nitrite reductase/ring-hydroxylating ferredoxin subunit
MRNASALVAFVTIAVLVSGCMESGPSTSTNPQATTLASGPVRLTVGENKDIGRYLADSRGMALYVYKKDSPGKSNCLGQCAQNWPPLEATGDVSPAAGTPGTFTVVARTDGTKQVAYNGMPLYFYAGDKNAGDILGNGVGDVWSIASIETVSIKPTQTTLSGQAQQVTTTLAGQVPQATTTLAAAAAPAGTFIAKVSDVLDGSSVDFTYNGDKAILVNIGGKYRAYVNKCTHKGCPLALGDGTLNCPCHGSLFDPSSGSPTKGPATTPLTPIEVRISGDSIYAS